MDLAKDVDVDELLMRQRFCLVGRVSDIHVITMRFQQTDGEWGTQSQYKSEDHSMFDEWMHMRERDARNEIQRLNRYCTVVADCNRCRNRITCITAGDKRPYKFFEAI